MHQDHGNVVTHVAAAAAAHRGCEGGFRASGIAGQTVDHADHGEGLLGASQSRCLCSSCSHVCGRDCGQICHPMRCSHTSLSELDQYSH